MQQISQKVEKFSQKNPKNIPSQKNSESQISTNKSPSPIQNAQNNNNSSKMNNSNYNQDIEDNSKLHKKEQEIEDLKLQASDFHQKIKFYKKFQYIAALIITILSITLISFTLYLNDSDHDIRRFYGFTLSCTSVILAMGLVTLNFNFQIFQGFIYVVVSIIIGIGSLFISIFMNVSRFYQDKNDDVQPIIQPHTDKWYTVDHIATWVFDILPVLIICTSVISLIQLQQAQKIKSHFERVYNIQLDIDRQLNEPLLESGGTHMTYQQEFLNDFDENITSRRSTKNGIELQNSMNSNQLNSKTNQGNNRRRQISESNIKVKTDNNQQSGITSNNYNRTTEASKITDQTSNRQTEAINIYVNNKNNDKINKSSLIMTNNKNNQQDKINNNFNNKMSLSSNSQDNYSNLKYIQQQKNANTGSINDDQIISRIKNNKRSEDITEQIPNTYVAFDKKLKEVSVSFVGQTDSSQNNDNSPLKVSQNLKYQKSNSSARPFQGKLKFTQSSSEFQIKNGQLFDSVYEESGENHHLGGPHINDLIGKRNDQSKLQEFNEDLEFESSYD